ncbi:MAG: FAD-dependent oxidoreductase [Myxococcota bacterium]
MPRSSLFARLRRTLLLALGAERRGAPTAEHVEATAERHTITRRQLMQRAALGVGALAVAPRLLAACGDGAATPKERSVAIVGAGMAGLLCAYRLRQAGVTARIFDGNNRVGGRMFTARGRMAEGQLFELGGEFIDSEHSTLRALAVELGLALDDMNVIDDGLQKDLFYFGGEVKTEAVVVDAWRKVVARIAADAAEAETAAGVTRLDAIPLSDYLATLPDLEPFLRDLLDVAYATEYGLAIDQQSALNLLWLIGSDDADAFEVFGTSDERFHTHAGNDRFPTILADGLAAQIDLDHRLVAIAQASDGRWRLTFTVHSSTYEALFDHVVLALPWTMLRQVVITPAWPEPKGKMIRELGYGTNAKLMMQFRSRVWRKSGNSGGVYTDNGPQSLWDTSRGQDGASGILTVFTGAAEGLATGDGTAEDRAMLYLPKMEAFFPGVSGAYRAGSAQRMQWPAADLVLGSYACYKPGQAAWSGSEIERVGNIHFCGEHTSADFQGYMEGAAETGERCAAEILADLGVLPPA